MNFEDGGVRMGKTNAATSPHSPTVTNNPEPRRPADAGVDSTYSIQLVSRIKPGQRMSPLIQPPTPSGR
ncbi:MAG: hypothetical protein HC902_06705 [Calothrix sp. SM1_5_4]|nr:hypothetical protein [Calothrix sp. SM1_5_4]